jgi:hypothetical protein
VIIDAADNNFHTIDGRFEGGPATNAGPSASQPCP